MLSLETMVGLMITTEKFSDVLENMLILVRCVSILTGRLSILTAFCPVSCCYHKPCIRT